MWKRETVTDRTPAMTKTGNYPRYAHFVRCFSLLCFASRNQLIIIAMLHINNHITCFEYCEATTIAAAERLDEALDVALDAELYCAPCEPVSYFEEIITPFGTDERQCEHDALAARIAKWNAEPLPF